MHLYRVKHTVIGYAAQMLGGIGSIGDMYKEQFLAYLSTKFIGK